MPRPLRREPTDKQRAVVDALEGYMAKNGFQPSLRELAAMIGVNLSTIHMHISLLERKGIVQREGVRAIRVLRGANR